MHNMRGKEDADFLYACNFIHLNRMNWTDAVCTEERPVKEPSPLKVLIS